MKFQWRYLYLLFCVACGPYDCSFELFDPNGPFVCNNDGTIDPGETCDDGNSDDHDLCDSFCRVTSCGNGVRNEGELCFSTEESFRVGIQPTAMISGDVDGDGRDDLIFADFSLASVLVVLRESPFVALPEIILDAEPTALGLGDIDNDLDLDLVAVLSGVDSVQLLMNDGDGNFTPSTTLAVGDSPQSVVLEDFNGDNFIDIATANFLSDTVTVLQNQGSGVFQASSFITSSSPLGLTALDLNQDNALDLVTVHPGSNTILSLLNQGNGSFQASTSILTSSLPQDFAVGHINEDSFLDLAVLTSTGVDLFVSNGAGALSLSGQVLSEPSAMAFGDWNGDDLDDLALVLFEGRVEFYINRINAFTFASEQSTQSIGASAVAVGNFNGDSFEDIVVVNEVTAIIEEFQSQDQGNFGAPGGLSFTIPVNDLALGDIDQDAVLDLVAAGTNDKIQSLSRGAGVLSLPDLAALGNSPKLSLIDFENDGDLDLMAQSTEGLRCFENNGAGSFSIKQDFLFENLLKTKFADINEDGFVDIVFLEPQKISISSSTGAALFAPPLEIVLLDEVRGLEVADINSDGNLDLIFGTNIGIRTATGAGNGSFSEIFNLTLQNNDEFPTAVDIDQDGDIDLSYQNRDRNIQFFARNDGTGAFTSTFDIDEQLDRLSFLDMNDDSRLDAINLEIPGLIFYLSNGSSFGEAIALPVPDGLGDAEFLDLNNDGLMDVLVSIPQLQKVVPFFGAL